jgi:CHAT domain-containing protein
LLASGGATKRAVLKELQEHRQRYIVVGTHIEAADDEATPGVASAEKTVPTGYQLMLDEPVSMNELYGLNLSCELLGLLGCDSGQVNVLPGDELVGLMRACLFAGAERLVVTHWKMRVGAIREFIELLLPDLISLAPGSEPWVAAVAARTNLRSIPGREHPYYWAISFVGCPTV